MASLISGPSEGQIAEFCDNLKQSMLKAAKDGHEILLRIRPKYLDSMDPKYAGLIVDKIYAGATYEVDIQLRGR